MHLVRHLLLRSSCGTEADVVVESNREYHGVGDVGVLGRWSELKHSVSFVGLVKSDVR